MLLICVADSAIMNMDNYESGGISMPRAKKDHSCLNIKIDAGLYRRLMEVSEEAGQTKTMVVERALQGYFADYDMKQQILRQAAAGQLVPREEVSRDDD